LQGHMPEGNGALWVKNHRKTIRRTAGWSLGGSKYEWASAKLVPGKNFDFPRFSKVQQLA
jgi:hypothetical protein